METTEFGEAPSPGATGGPEYALGHSDPELERLSAQARLLDPFTRALFQDAGVREGMRVLDLGCGNGDVSLLAADLVGPLGRVVGLDRACGGRGRLRRTAAMPNVEVVHGDITQATFDEPFDAGVGRLVLMYCPDPVEAISRWRAGSGRAGRWSSTSSTSRSSAASLRRRSTRSRSGSRPRR
jgi:SAM-dependent methyltransferase